jgi:hypothetical protein
MKPLYLEGRDLHVGLDGPALKVSKPATADRLFPLQRLSRVVSSPHVDWELPALLACAGKGITVNFLDDDGELLARCIGKADDHDGLDRQLEFFLYRPDWEPLYKQWFKAVENMALRSVMRRSGLSLEGAPSPRVLRDLFREGAASMGASRAHARMGRELQALLESLVGQFLTDLGIDISRYHSKTFDLVGDIAGVLLWDFELARLNWLEGRLAANQPLTTANRLEVVQFFESRKERTERLLVGVIARLHRWLLDT